MFSPQWLSGRLPAPRFFCGREQHSVASGAAAIGYNQIAVFEK